MKYFYYITIPLIFILLVCSVIFMHWTIPLIVLGVYISIYLSANLFTVLNTRRVTKVSAKRIETEVANRIWEVPINVVCQFCQQDSEILFHLGANKHQCPRCQNTNKLHMIITTTPLSENENTTTTQ